MGYSDVMPDQNPQKDNIFWIEVEKIKPNSMQPRMEFDESKLQGLADSIREYGILQPLIVTREETSTEMGTAVHYELIAGERRYRAACMVGLREVPVVIRREEAQKVRLELALVENIQREDLNPLERALAYRHLADDFGLNQKEIGRKIGKSREAVTNTLRILTLPDEIKEGVRTGLISEGHTRPLLMLATRPIEQVELYRDVVGHHLSVRETESIARRIARERARKVEEVPTAETRAKEQQLENALGTRVCITRDAGGRGKIAIEFFSEEELDGLTKRLAEADQKTEEQIPESERGTFTV